MCSSQHNKLQITQNYVVDKRRVCECTIRGCSTFCRRFHLHSHDTKQLSTGFSNKGVTTRMTAFTNMFLKMHLIRSARGRHVSKIFASHAAGASQGITVGCAQSVRHPSALREPSAAPSSRCTLVAAGMPSAVSQISCTLVTVLTPYATATSGAAAHQMRFKNLTTFFVWFVLPSSARI